MHLVGARTPRCSRCHDWLIVLARGCKEFCVLSRTIISMKGESYGSGTVAPGSARRFRVVRNDCKTLSGGMTARERGRKLAHTDGQRLLSRSVSRTSTFGRVSVKRVVRAAAPQLTGDHGTKSSTLGFRRGPAGLQQPGWNTSPHFTHANLRVLGYDSAGSNDRVISDGDSGQDA